MEASAATNAVPLSSSTEKKPESLGNALHEGHTGALRRPPRLDAAELLMESVGKMDDEAASTLRMGELDEDSVNEAPAGADSGKAHRPEPGGLVLRLAAAGEESPPEVVCAAELGALEPPLFTSCSLCGERK